ncbi:hypothetical protein Back2_24230 [Nocardioides baekrokdamisoli]|uniref:Uncharacterized protein n=1 Tax=Nocardioides baekrokdamisoli TaxID=1804624 RepID=A0A3G9IIF7_9ACTN|nr:hypothetical protein [Nocardioides baekrokdamisoli]BBH18136.1 hypothetical protein Back2_24230 [Nocardioides baekrokdamisoli]
MPNTLTHASDKHRTDSRTDWGPHAEYDPDAHWDAADVRPDDN